MGVRRGPIARGRQPRLPGHVSPRVRRHRSGRRRCLPTRQRHGHLNPRRHPRRQLGPRLYQVLGSDCSSSSDATAQRPWLVVDGTSLTDLNASIFTAAGPRTPRTSPAGPGRTTLEACLARTTSCMPLPPAMPRPPAAPARTALVRPTPATASSCISAPIAGTTPVTRSRASGSCRTASPWAPPRAAAALTSTASTRLATSCSSAISVSVAPSRRSASTSGTRRLVETFGSSRRRPRRSVHQASPPARRSAGSSTPPTGQPHRGRSWARAGKPASSKASSTRAASTCRFFPLASPASASPASSPKHAPRRRPRPR